MSQSFRTTSRRKKQRTARAGELPEALVVRLSALGDAFRGTAEGTALEALRTAGTSAGRVAWMSQWTAGARRDPPTALSPHWAVIAADFFVPWAMDVDGVDVHRPLLGVLRRIVDRHGDVVRAAFGSQWIAKVGDLRGEGVEEAMDALALIDHVDSTMSRVFAEEVACAYEHTLPVAAKALKIVEEEVARERKTGLSALAVDRLRFAIRVVSTSHHRHFNRLPPSPAASQLVGTLLQTALKCLRNAALPKDVMNAAAIIVVTAVAQQRVDAKIALIFILGVLNESLYTSEDFEESWMMWAERCHATSISRHFGGLTPCGRQAAIKAFFAHWVDATILLESIDGQSSLELAANQVIADVGGDRTTDVRYIALQTLEHLLKYIDSLARIENGKVALRLQTPTVVTMLTEFVRVTEKSLEDPTLPATGPHTTAFHVLLQVSQRLHSDCEFPLVCDPHAMMQGALDAPPDRRSRYHTILQTASMMASEGVVEMLRRRMGSVAGFVDSLLSVAANPRVCGLAGEVALLSIKSAADPADVGNCIDVIAKALVRPPLPPRNAPPTSSVREAIAAHFVAPMLKISPPTAEALLRSIAAVGGPCALAATVEVLHRANIAGIPVNRSDRDIFQKLIKGVEAGDHALRTKSLSLLLSVQKETEPVAAVEFDVVLYYIGLHMHHGSESAARKHALVVLSKWLQRVAQSVSSSRARGEDLPKWRESVLVTLRGIRQLSSMCASHADPSWSAERRFMALTVAMSIINHIAPILYLPNGEIHSTATSAALIEVWGDQWTLAHAMLPMDLLRGALTAAYDGWDALRQTAANVLRYALRLRINMEDISMSDVVAEAVASLPSPSFRRAMGGAVILSLFGSRAPDRMVGVVVHEGKGDVSEAEAAVKSITCTTLEIPCHGMLLWCLESWKHILEGDRGHARAWAPSVLQTCCNVLERVRSVTCQLDVDCRGHIVSDGGRSERELRLSVNNLWLAVRSSCTVIVEVVDIFAAESAPPALAETLCLIAADVLLQTKHNGVMGKCRMALRAVSRAYLTSTSAAHRNVVAGIIRHLLHCPLGVLCETEERVLRRSQGLTHGIVAVLEAEDPPYPLTARVVRELLDTAENHTSPQTLTVAHAINASNVLRYIFDDATLFKRCAHVAEEALLRAAGRFAAEGWAVRNGALMLFSAVLRRVIGDHVASGSTAATTRFSDLAARLPRLVDWIAAHLREVADGTQRGEAGDSSYPILALLAMLAPPLAPDPNSAVTPLMVTCRRLRMGNEWMLRSAAAAAELALCPTSAVAEWLRESTALAREVGSDNAKHGMSLLVRKCVQQYIDETATVDAGMWRSSIALCCCDIIADMWESLTLSEALIRSLCDVTVTMLKLGYAIPIKLENLARCGPTSLSAISSLGECIAAVTIFCKFEDIGSSFPRTLWPWVCAAFGRFLNDDVISDIESWVRCVNIFGNSPSSPAEILNDVVSEGCTAAWYAVVRGLVELLRHGSRFGIKTGSAAEVLIRLATSAHVPADVASAAIRAVAAVCDDGRLVAVLSRRCVASEPLLCRAATVSGLSCALERKTLDESTRGQLWIVGMVLAHDDDDGVRSAMCEVVGRIIAPTDVTYCHAIATRAVAQEIQCRISDIGRTQFQDMWNALWKPNSSSSDSDGSDEETLFEAEESNDFAESPLLHSWLAFILDGAPCPTPKRPEPEKTSAISL